MDTQNRRASKSEVQMILEFIGYRTLVVLGLGVSVYLYSGYYNYMQGMNPLKAFSPYYALHFHNGGRILGAMAKSASDFSARQWDWFLGVLVAIRDRIVDFLNAYVNPFISAHPVLGFAFFFTVGILITAFFLVVSILAVRKVFVLLSPAAVERLARNVHKEEVWDFDPRRKPSDEQIKSLLRTLERLVQRAPAMGGSVPKNADISIRELARRNHDSDYTYRNAIYVMGPIKGTKIDNSYEVPMALDQIRKITGTMGMAATYEVLPLDLVMLRTKKGSKSIEIDPETAPISLGKTYPVSLIEKVMTDNRSYFIWDARASKTKTGYGRHG